MLLNRIPGSLDRQLIAVSGKGLFEVTIHSKWGRASNELRRAEVAE